jgi:hypothetical protein
MRTLFLERTPFTLRQKSEKRCERTRGWLTEKTKTHTRAALSCSACKSPARHHAGREPIHAITAARSFHEGQACCEPPNNQSPTHPVQSLQSHRAGAKAGRSHSRKQQTGDSHRENAQTTHTLPTSRSARTSVQDRACCWAQREAEQKPFKKGRNSTQHAAANRSKVKAA